MRVKIGNQLFLCRCVSKNMNKDNMLLLINDRYGVYEVDCESSEIRENLVQKLLSEGWADLSKFTYKRIVD